MTIRITLSKAAVKKAGSVAAAMPTSRWISADDRGNEVSVTLVPRNPVARNSRNKSGAGAHRSRKGYSRKAKHPARPSE